MSAFERYPAIRAINTLLTLEDYNLLYEQSINNPEIFWANMSESNIEWYFKLLVKINFTSK